MLVIPTQPIASQTLRCVLGEQICTIRIYQKTTGLFLDLLVNDEILVGGVICQVGNRIVRSAYLGFMGDLAFYDTRPADPPLAADFEPDEVHYLGLGGRFFLAYLP